MRIAKILSNSEIGNQASAASLLAFLAAAGWLGVATNVAAAGDRTFAKVCAEQDVQVITLIEDHGQASLIEPLVETETLARAGVMLLEARGACYRGQVAEAVALYDKIIVTLGPVPERQTQ